MVRSLEGGEGEEVGDAAGLLDARVLNESCPLAFVEVESGILDPESRGLSL